jgi:GT2 family glycosyltransferase
MVDSAKKADIKPQIIIVDNSAQETSAELKAILPSDVKIIENIENQGFSKANNQGIIASKGKYILLLNNDAFVNAECLINGIRFIENDKECGIWAPKLVGEDGSFQVSCAELPSIKGLFNEYVLLKNNTPYPDLKEWKEPHDVGNVIGAFMLMKKEITEKVGLLDEDYFFTVEDVDYCKRIHDAGFSVIYDPRSKITHIGGASQDDKWINDPYVHKFRVLYFKKNHGKFKTFLSKIIISLGLNIRKGFTKYSKIRRK